MINIRLSTLRLIQSHYGLVPNEKQNTEFQAEFKPKSEGMNQKSRTKFWFEPGRFWRHEFFLI